MTTAHSSQRILFCCNIYPPDFVGGAELIAHAQARLLQAMGHQVLVLAGDSKPRGEQYSVYREKYDGIQVVRLQLTAADYRNDRINFFHRGVEDQFQRLLEEFRPEVVHFHNMIGLSVGMIYLAKKSGARTILTLHDKWGICYKTTTLDLQGRPCRDYERCPECLAFLTDGGRRHIPIRFRQDYIKLQFSYLDRIISPSRYLADCYTQAGFAGDQIQVLWNGVDVDRFAQVKRRQDSPEVRFTYVGHFGGHKGVEVLLRALPLLSPAARVRINLVGEGEARPGYLDLLQRLQCTGMVKFWGKVENRHIEKVYQDTDVLVLPSIGPENQPVSITEAMACRLPVITSRLGGAVELVEDGLTGLLFESGSDSDLAAKMNEFIRDPGLIDAMGQNGYEKIKDFTLENQVQALEKIYTQAASGGPEPLRTIAAVAGDRVNLALAQGIEDYVRRHPLERAWFVKDEWLADTQMGEVDLMCIADATDWLLPAIRALRRAVPLLVPEANRELKELCLAAACGLFYEDELEARLCLEYLLEPGGPGPDLGKNGGRFIERPI